MLWSFIGAVAAIVAFVSLAIWLDGCNRRAVLRRHFKRKRKP